MFKAKDLTNLKRIDERGCFAIKIKGETRFAFHPYSFSDRELLTTFLSARI